MAFYLWFYRKTLRFPQATLLVPLGVVAIWLANAVRIAALILIGTWFSPAVALGGFHSQAGWLAFNVVALGLVAVAGRSPFFSMRDFSDRQDIESQRTVPGALPGRVGRGHGHRGIFEWIRLAVSDARPGSFGHNLVFS